MLTSKEKVLVKQYLKEYPKGIDSDQWGYGDLSGGDVPEDSFGIDDIISEFG